MQQENNRVVGIAGSVPGSGVTHLSVALANYAASGLGEKTACLELSGRGEFGHWKAAGAEGYFVDRGIHFYPDFPEREMPILMNRDYERIILDFGEDYVRCREEILRCHRKIFLLNLNPWQMSAAEKLISTVQGDNWKGIRPCYASLHTDRARKKAMEKKFGIRIEELPILNQPCCIPAEAFACLDGLLAHHAAVPKKKKQLIPIKIRKR